MVPQSEVVPPESKQFDSIRVYTMSEIEPVRIDSNLCASVNGLLHQWLMCIYMYVLKMCIVRRLVLHQFYRWCASVLTGI